MADLDPPGELGAAERRCAPDDDRGWILVLCTGNVCRSPMAAALLARALAVRDVNLLVRSAGTLPGGYPALADTVAAMAERGLDISRHVSRAAEPADLSGAALVLGMARENVRHAVVLEPAAWPRAFTLKELVRRGGRTGPRPPGEPLAAWLGRVQDDRDRAALLGSSEADDVPDPAGGPRRAYADTAALLDRLTGQLAALCWPLRD